MKVCDCGWHSYMVGDGCDQCNPAKSLEYAKETIADLEQQLAEARELLLGVQPTEQQQPSWYERRDVLLSEESEARWSHLRTRIKR